MNFFVNEFQYTPEFINESVGAWWERRFKRGYIGMTVPLAKGGFKAGDAENCLNYLKERTAF